MATVTKKDLVTAVAEKCGCQQSLARDAVQTFLDRIIAELGNNNRIELREFGVFEVRVREDLRHVSKHRRRYLAGMEARGEESAPPEVCQRSFLAAAWMRLGKPAYNFVTRRLLRTSDGEPRRPEAGPWPRWGPPVGPEA